MGEKKAMILSRQIMTRMVDTVLPPLTLFPGLASDADWTAVNFIDEPCCQTCGFPFEFDLRSIDGAQTLCARCTARPPAYTQARAAFAYDDHSRSAVLAFKHGGRTEALSMFAAHMHRAGRHMLTDSDRLVPVPLHYSRLVERRYNQATLLANAVSKLSGTSVSCDVLSRKRKTGTQGGLSYSGRRRNVSGAFVPRKGCDLRGQRIVLIDDVFTTGATLESCARTLLRAGAASVCALTLARVVKGSQIPT